MSNILFAAGLDVDTKLLLHVNTDYTDSSDSAHTITAVLDAHIDGTTKKWGAGSVALDGTGDILTAPDSSDWDIFTSTADNWTIDLWVKHTDHSGNEGYMSHGPDGNHFWQLRHDDGVGTKWQCYNDDTAQGMYITGTEITDTNWHHIAVVKKANEHGLYLDGVQIGYGTYNFTFNFNSVLAIGVQRFDSVLWFDGNMDEIRIQKSNYFNASPNVGLTDTITVPTAEYSADVVVTSQLIVTTLDF